VKVWALWLALFNTAWELNPLGVFNFGVSGSYDDVASAWAGWLLLFGLSGFENPTTTTPNINLS
jgi:hypothetical protein